jgi:arylsulfatase A-like enzyme
VRILYIDIDSQRPDHLGCYGYHRNTTPNIDRVAQRGVRFDNYYVSDAPCLPSRTAMWSGRFGIHNGVVNHGGVAAEPFVEGPGRQFNSLLGTTGWMHCLRRLGHATVTVSPFGERHSAWHWYANFSEVYNTGGYGIERADEVSPYADRWLRANARREDWFLHVNFWDPHTPYRTPDSFGDPFKDAPLPVWLTDDVRREHWDGVGPHSAREIIGYDDVGSPNWPKQPERADSMVQVRRMFDGYDNGVRYADEHIGRLLNTLADHGVLDETAVVITADHGENLGELNIYGDHQTADHITCRVPLVLSWPGVARAGAVDAALHYHVDFAATVIELLGGTVPPNWDGRSFAAAVRAGREEGREFLVISQGAWSCQRAVRFDDYLVIRSYHDAYHGFPDVMLFDLRHDPHEQRDLAPTRPETVARGLAMLDEWHAAMMRTASQPIDPMWSVLSEGGPFHVRGQLDAYVKRLRQTGRERWAEELLRKHSPTK